MRGLQINVDAEIVMLDGIIEDNPFCPKYDFNPYVDYVLRNEKKVKQWYAKWNDGEYWFDDYIWFVYENFSEFGTYKTEVDKKELGLAVYQICKLWYSTFASRKRKQAEQPLIFSTELEKGYRGILEDALPSMYNITPLDLVDSKLEWQEQYTNICIKFEKYVGDETLLHKIRSRELLYEYFFVQMSETMIEVCDTHTIKLTEVRKYRKELLKKTSKKMNVDEELVNDVLTLFFEETRSNVAVAKEIWRDILDLLQTGCVKYWTPEEYTEGREEL